MKNYLAGLIFLISSLASAMKVTETIKAEEPNFHTGGKVFFSCFKITLPDGREVWLPDDDGFASLAYALQHLKRGDQSKQSLFNNIIDRALERLTQVEHGRDKVETVKHFINERSLDRLKALEKFVSDNQNNFYYGFYNEADKTSPWGGWRFANLGLMATDTPLPPILISSDHARSLEKKSEAPPAILSKEVTIKKLVDPEKQMAQAIVEAFPVFDKILRSARFGKCETGKALLSENSLKELISEDATNNLIRLFGDIGETKKVKFPLTILDGTAPIYVIVFLKPGPMMNPIPHRFWVFKIEIKSSPDSEHFVAQVTRQQRIGPQPNFDLVELVFPDLHSCLKEIDSL